MGKRSRLLRQMILLGLILLEGALVAVLARREKPVTAVDWLGAYSVESEEFRAMAFGDGTLEQIFEKAGQWDEDAWSLAAAVLVRTAVAEQNGASSGKKAAPSEAAPDIFPDYQEYRGFCQKVQKEKPVEWTKFVSGVRTVLADARCFPVALNESGFSGISYENGWGDARTYGGERRHEGIDIMDNENVRGSYPIVSVSDGVVEHIGWLEQGGYRIGIRSPHGAYFYYAHLAFYAGEFTVGQPVMAGQVIGYMGDTGYSAVEGTVGNFPVHLHFGIYLETDHYDELSVNPYYILKYLEKNAASYTKESFLWYSLSERSVRTAHGDTIMAGNPGSLRAGRSGTGG